MSRRYPAVARTILLDKTDGTVWVDGKQIPAAILADYTIEPMTRRVEQLTVSIMARSVVVVRSIDDDLQWIQDVADLHRIELGLPTKYGRVERAPF